MSRIAILISTTDGHTRTIGERIANAQRAAGHQVDVLDLTVDAQLQDYDRVLVGASIRYGKFQPTLFEFVKAQQQVLESKDSGFFGVNVVARKPEKNRVETNPYMQKLLEAIDWQPTHIEVFAGRIDYPKYSFFDRTMIRFIMWITKGPTDITQSYEFTDWQRVDDFAQSFIAKGA
ncbi:menaquinone-dependent protoporphyrinogen IX dehydrogenase [Paraferrimonas sedimenticola]|uniref:Protoporphyrinogen IX dehydrogenase [quinone] n=1 Tax=Paraferrimonas sedimenticola TaxID=375674 RepID=A0AA37VZQ5_9GAMM|nr:menaquinone-dependent protoporphyrinogen IX dehydrogenase [Paraferrimonas sedimenticola]GLP97691.1 protoporphyrinogen oxidase [Paraferrimonas sedimenticola]